MENSLWILQHYQERVVHPWIVLVNRQYQGFERPREKTEESKQVWFESRPSEEGVKEKCRVVS